MAKTGSKTKAKTKTKTKTETKAKTTAKRTSKTALQTKLSARTSAKILSSIPALVREKLGDLAENTEVLQILAHVRPTPMIDNTHTSAEKIAIISEKFREIMEVLGLDLTNDSLQNTPNRIAKMYVNEIFSGLDADHFPKMTVIENEMQYDQMVLVQDVEVLSVCEHHFQTIHGVATVAYIPNRKVIGLSKINRIVQFFARRPQVQERLTKQIADCLQYVLDTDHVAVHMNAKHYCVIARGVQDNNSSTATSDLRGHFKSKADTRSEFLSHCRTSLRSL